MHRSIVGQLIAVAPAARPPWARRWRRRLSVGTLAMVGALGAFASSPAESISPHEVGQTTLVGLRVVATERVAYQPGASRAWAAGSQVVGVKVLSGRLTVYGNDGAPRIYAQGEGYAAGWADHRTVNETGERVETLVTSHVRP